MMGDSKAYAITSQSKKIVIPQDYENFAEKAKF